ncbi:MULTISPECIES: amidohydrolase family protein [Acidobacterium]|uniref:Amidohydrolase family protein n=1 Tax=Acidobacterium capsulatum (strain ATCC 51196 / DSM 11244 / BCRC 80197 / JCM 7670 / NBRC 15755 / NCIMB 13165 / 161) TaxID=240015 RepID=C1F5U6_ACIC5|nr:MULTISPECIES: amidohydrolase family protein [Acidobacterium]ACO32694.1 Amidohydrolase family protein [Acidobacterium capsulatum ATCC 51196]HCT61106.1 amidohydrolase [Acidobacterium sp.]
MYAVDAHHHFWRYSEAEYGWIDDSMQMLRRDFLPHDLEHEMHRAEVRQTVAVQARQTLEETHWLLQLAEKHSFLAGVVGWAPIASPDFPHILESLQSNSRLKGLRHVLQGEPDERYALQPDFTRGLSLLAPAGLVYDILIYAHQLPAAIELADLHPNQTFVLDHLAKPSIAARELSPWRKQLRRLAERPNVMCKISGMVTEADWLHWTPEDLSPYLETALECFGPERLLAGSDWPVCTVAASYSRWWQTLRAWASALSLAEQESILGGNATRIYRLKDHSA